MIDAATLNVIRHQAVGIGHWALRDQMSIHEIARRTGLASIFKLRRGVEFQRGHGEGMAKDVFAVSRFISSPRTC